MRRFGFQRPAEAMARAAGTAFRLFAGTDSLNVGLTASHTASLDPNDPQVHPKHQRAPYYARTRVVHVDLQH